MQIGAQQNKFDPKCFIDCSTSEKSYRFPFLVITVFDILMSSSSDINVHLDIQIAKCQQEKIAYKQQNVSKRKQHIDSKTLARENSFYFALLEKKKSITDFVYEKHYRFCVLVKYQYVHDFSKCITKILDNRLGCHI